MNAPFTPGTHLVTDRTLYDHHGIYVGDGRVVHYAGLADGWESGPVEEVSLEQFANGDPVVASTHFSRFSGAEIVARARSRLGENLYDLFRNNCEHFSQWCVTGRRRSWQVWKWASLPSRVLGACIDLLYLVTLSARLVYIDLAQNIWYSRRRPEAAIADQQRKTRPESLATKAVA
jgi:hypothetical protein